MSWKNVQYENGKYRTSEGGGGGGSSTFAGLDDVSFDNLQYGQVPKYNSTTQKWENADESGGGGTVTDVQVNGTSVVNPQTGVAEITTPSVPSKLSDLSDIDLSNIQNGQIIKWDATNNKWINANESGVIALPECVCKRTGYSGNTGFSESMQQLNIASGQAAFSVEAYFYLYDASDGYILSFGNGNTHAVMGMGASSIVTWGDDWSLPGTHTGLHHRVITYDGNLTMKIYQDNSLIYTKTFNSTLNIANTSIYWGLWITGGYGVRGNVHYAKYYNRALTADEVSLLYANRKNQF